MLTRESLKYDILQNGLHIQMRDVGICKSSDFAVLGNAAY